MHHLLVWVIKSWHLLNRSSWHSFMSTWASHFNIFIPHPKMWFRSSIHIFSVLLENFRVLESIISNDLLLKWILVRHLGQYWSDVLNAITSNRSSSEEIVRIFLVFLEETAVWVLFLVFTIWSAFCLNVPRSLHLGINDLSGGRRLHLRLVISLFLNHRVSHVHLVVFLVHNSIKVWILLFSEDEFIFIFLK